MFDRKYIFKWWIFHLHVSFLGGNPSETQLFSAIYRGFYITLLITISSREPTTLVGKKLQVAFSSALGAFGGSFLDGRSQALLW